MCPLLERNIMISLLSANLNMCLGSPKEPSHRDGSFEYTQHNVLVEKKNNLLSILQSYQVT